MKKNIHQHFIISLFILFMGILNNLPAQESFYQVLPDKAGKTEEVSFHNIPFKIVSTDKGYANLASQSITVDNRHADEPVQAVFFLGMVTEKPEACAWWGPTERFYAFNNELFIGDQLGKIFIIYNDTTADVIPIIFGVNMWNYELLNQVKKSETYLNTYGGPYQEPFLSDKNAKSLLDSSLVLMENDTVKGGKYILGIKTRNKPVAKIILQNDDLRNAGIYISGVTCRIEKADVPGLRLVDERFFAQKKYYAAMDKLARRLYQFRDELPAADPYNPPEGYDAPVVKFSGTPLAEVFSNVYAHNIYDMRTKKVDGKGGMHTSSGDQPNFGIYIGMGTFQAVTKSYYEHVWSRDAGRCMMEVIESGETERSQKAGDEALRLLYDTSSRFSQPHWQRIANASKLNNESLWRSVSGKENDGHGSMMLFIYRLIQHKCVDIGWVKNNWNALCDAAEWYCWQMNNPKESGFDKVLSSETEAATQQYGIFDLFSNWYAYTSLKAFTRLSDWTGDKAKEDRWNNYADRLYNGIMNMFTTIHPRYGKIFTDVAYDCWTYEYKRFVPLFLAPDLTTYDLALQNPELYQICYNTYLAQKEEFFSYDAGRQMGYGQGFITESAIMLDESDDMKGYLEQAAAFCYHHSDNNYIVPEGVIMHPSGRFWFRNSDLGNGVQQAEIVKAARLLVGLDDLNPEKGLNIIPRLPSDWNAIDVHKYPVIATDSEGNEIYTDINYQYKKITDGFQFSIEANNPVRLGSIRLGPFDNKNVKIVDGNMPYSVIEIRDKTFIYFNFSDKVIKNWNVTAVSLH